MDCSKAQMNIMKREECLCLTEMSKHRHFLRMSMAEKRSEDGQEMKYTKKEKKIKII